MPAVHILLVYRNSYRKHLRSLSIDLLPCKRVDSVHTYFLLCAGDYDQLDGSFVAGLLGFTDLRTRLIGSARGSVLEVAVGTGLNLSLYNRQQITHYIGLDLSPGMLQQV